MTEDLRLRTVSQVKAEHLEQFTDLLREAVADSVGEAQDPDSGMLGYSAFVDTADGTVVLYEHYANADAFQAHLGVNRPRRGALRALLRDDVGVIEVYGPAPTALIEQLQAIGLPVRHLASLLGASGLL